MRILIVLASLVSIMSAQAGAVTVRKPAPRSGSVDPARIEGAGLPGAFPVGGESWADRSARPPARLSSGAADDEGLTNSGRALMLAGIAAIGFLLNRRNVG